MSELENLQEEEEVTTIEVYIDESGMTGIDAISIVENPAIESDFIFLSKQSKVKLAEVDKEKRIIMGPALIPNKPIFRVHKEEEYYIYFSEETVRKASELYFKNGNQSNATLEHEVEVEGLTTVESWIVEDTEMDKATKYGFDVPLGTWMVTMKVDNDIIWDEFVKTGKVKGFSIEAYLAHRVDMARMEKVSEEELDNIDALVTLYDIMEEIAGGESVELDSYTDYPKAATNSAKRAIKYKEENGSDCGTQVGWTRARQLADRKPISRSTIARMASFKRHQQHKDIPYTEGCGGIMWDAWGGSAGVNWAISKLDELK